MLAGVFASIAGALAGSALAPEPQAGLGRAEPYVSYYFDERRELTLDTSRVAVFGIGARHITGADIGMTGARVEILPLLSAHLIELPDDDRTRAGVERVLNHAATQRSEKVAYTAPVFVGQDGGPVVPTASILVQFSADSDPATNEAALKQFGVISERAWGGIDRAYRVTPNTLDGRDVLEWAAALAQRHDTVFAEPDMLFTGSSSMSPNDEFFFSSWGLDNVGQNVGGIGFADNDVNAVEAWDTTLGDPNMLTLIIDQGVQPDHPDLNQVPGMDFTSDNGPDGGPVNDCDNHGTSVAGVVSGIINNQIGSCGVAPNSNIVSARAHISDIPCTGRWTSVSSWTVNALAFGETLGVRVTNNSNRYGFTASAIASKYALTEIGTGVTDPMIHFAASGNDSNATQVDYPASIPSVNAISAMDNRGLFVSFSNGGPNLFMSGPGRDVRTTDRTGFAGFTSTDYGLLDGTSFSSPFVAGVAALVLSHNPSLTSDELETILRTTAKDLGDPGFDQQFGWGIPDAQAALLAAGDPVCVADCDDSGSLNFDDIDCFVAGFLGGDLAVADCDDSGALNFDDIDCFVAAFLAGCP